MQRFPLQKKNLSAPNYKKSSIIFMSKPINESEKVLFMQIHIFTQDEILHFFKCQTFSES